MVCDYIMNYFLILATLGALTFAKVPDYYGKYSTATETFEIGGMTTGGSQDALITYPHDTKDTGFPVVVFAHGMTGGGWKLYFGYNELLRTIASHGYVVVSPKACPDVWCENWALDIATAIERIYANHDLAKQLELADFTKLAIVGHSMGGDAVVRVSTMSDIYSKFPLIATVAFNPAVFYDKQAKSADIKVPVFFITGTKDTTVSPQSVVKAFEEDETMDKIIANVVGDPHKECTIEGSRHMNSYAAWYLDCKVKGISDACDLFYDDKNPDYLCNNGIYTYDQCEVKMNSDI